MMERDEPRADPLAPPSPLAEGIGPQCPVHGKMTWQPPGTAETCWLMEVQFSVACSCQPGQFVCGGLDGEGCVDTEPVTLAEYLASLRA